MRVLKSAPQFANVQCVHVKVTPRLPKSTRGLQLRMKGVGEDVVSGWFDMARLVSSGGESKSPFGELAEELGRDVYVDINGWHLYLRDITVQENLKLHSALATQLGPRLQKGDFDEASIEQFLRQVPLSLGGGKLKVRLTDALPSYPLSDFMKICREYAERH